ncbi:unnamed protein product [Phaedon cochleariae]|uniref:CCHC-type domain-containing protein n=1 Tax=Phaedon cochleariae TaxID=80249 RepID=A0A9N9SD14_PHACE|nr:unnamed protein product [Phaedon cochleariae]
MSHCDIAATAMSRNRTTRPKNLTRTQSSGRHRATYPWQRRRSRFVLASASFVGRRRQFQSVSESASLMAQARRLCCSRAGGGSGSGGVPSVPATVGAALLLRGPGPPPKRPDALLDVAAKVVAENIPFQRIEERYDRIPEPVQRRIVFWSFPRNERDICMYSSLSRVPAVNSNGEPQNLSFCKGLKLLETGCVDGVLQVVDQVRGIQFDHVKSQVYVKLVSNIVLQATLAKFEQGPALFEDEDGIHEVGVTEATDEILVRVYDFPFEMPNEKIRCELSKYGTVTSIRNESWRGEGMYVVESGVRQVKINMKRHIPSFIRIDGTTSLVSYPNQIRTCMICEDPGHIRRDCPKRPVNRIHEIRRPNVPYIVPEQTHQQQLTVDSIPPIVPSVREEVHEITACTEDDSENLDRETVTDEILNEPERLLEEGSNPDSIEPVLDVESHDRIEEPQYTPVTRKEKKQRKRNLTKNEQSTSEEEKKVPKLKINLKQKDAFMEYEYNEVSKDREKSGRGESVLPDYSVNEFY